MQKIGSDLICGFKGKSGKRHGKEFLCSTRPFKKQKWSSVSSSSVPSAAGTLRQKKCGGQVGKEAWRHEGMAKPPCVGCVLNPLVDGQANAVSTGSRQKLRCESKWDHPAPLQKLWDYFRLSIMIIGTLSSVHIFNANWGSIFPEARFYFRDVHENTLDVGHMAWALHNLNLDLSSERSPNLDMLVFVPDKICPFFILFIVFLAKSCTCDLDTCFKHLAADGAKFWSVLFLFLS